MIGIYKITNKINGKSYIGQSIHIEQRWQEHQMKSQTSLIHRALEKYGVENFSFKVLEQCNQVDLDEREKYWIAYYNTFEDGYNLTRGGGEGFKYDVEEVYQTFLQLQNLAQTARKIGCHETTVRNILRTYDINLSIKQEDKPVEQIDPKTLQVIREFKTVQDAADAMKVNRSAISMAINGQHQTSAGYIWRAKGDTQKILNDSNKRWKCPVEQMDLQGNILAEYESAAEAARQIGHPGRGCQIISVCKGINMTSYGYRWRYRKI